MCIRDRAEVGEADGNELALSYERDVNGGTFYISYIKITKVESTSADLSKLEQLYKVVDSLSNEESMYEENSWKALQTAKSAAKVYLDRENVPASEQAEVDSCERTLGNAFNNLKTTASADSNLLYFVDCGDRNPATASEGVVKGTLQGSLTDQVFAKGIDTEYSWGLYDKNGDRDGYEPVSYTHLVENAILHGFENVGRAHRLLVSIRKEEKELCVRIEDNGKGIPEDVLEKIREGNLPKTSEKNHIGMENAIMRMRMYYGEKAKIRIESEVDKGTVVTLLFPVDEGEEE